MSFYDGMAQTARRLLGRFGAPVLITRESYAEIDPVSGREQCGFTEEFTPNGVFLNIDKRLIDGQRIQQGDRMLVIDDSLEPKAEDKVRVDVRDWHIMEINPVKPAGKTLCTFLRIRR